MRSHYLISQRKLREQIGTRQQLRKQTGIRHRLTLLVMPWIISTRLKRGSQHPSHKFEILWQVAQSSFSPLLSYFVAQYVLIIVV